VNSTLRAPLQVFGWGYNGSGQLGIGSTANQLTPTKLNGLVGVVISNLVCGFSHTLALSDGGALYGWGLNGFGQLGTGDKGNQSAPLRICNKIGRYIFVRMRSKTRIIAKNFYTRKSYAPRYISSLECCEIILSNKITGLTIHFFICISSRLTDVSTLRVSLSR